MSYALMLHAYTHFFTDMMYFLAVVDPNKMNLWEKKKSKFFCEMHVA